MQTCYAIFYCTVPIYVRLAHVHRSVTGTQNVYPSCGLSGGYVY